MVTPFPLHTLKPAFNNQRLLKNKTPAYNKDVINYNVIYNVLAYN